MHIFHSLATCMGCATVVGSAELDSPPEPPALPPEPEVPPAEPPAEPPPPPDFFSAVTFTNCPFTRGRASASCFRLAYRIFLPKLRLFFFF